MELHRFFSAGSYTSGSKVAEELMRKRFVLDTNILLHFHNAISGFEKNDVYLLGTTLEELDAKKTEFGGSGIMPGRRSGFWKSCGEKAI